MDRNVGVSPNHKRPHQQHQPQTPHKNYRAYKLLIDPFLVKGATKLYRYDGVVPSDPLYPPVQLRDPRPARTRIWLQGADALDIPVPKFRVSFIS